MRGWLQADDLVDLVIEGGWRRPARVTRIGDNAVIVSTTDGSLRLPGGLAVCAGAIEWGSPNGTLRVQGVLRRGDDGALCLEAAPDSPALQRRRFDRIPAHLSASLIVGRTTRRTLTKTVDLSVGGMLVEAGPGLNVSDRVQFALDLGGATVTGDGEVVRSTADGALAVRFGHLPPTGERTLSQFVSDHR